MRIAVTGAAGFIGSTLCKKLCAEGHTVVGYDDLSTGHIERIKDLPVDFHEKSITDRFALDRAFLGVKAVIHCAALISVPESFQNERKYREVNYWGSMNVIRAARACGAERFIFPSSCAVYGAPHKNPVKENTKLDPQSPYAEQKLEIETILRTNYPGWPTIFRIFNCYGPGQSEDSPYSGVVARFCDAKVTGVAGTIHGDGKQMRDFVHVQDVSEGLSRALRGTFLKKTTLGTFNLGFGRPESIVGLYGHIINREPIKMPAREGDVKKIWADITRLRKVFRWAPKIDLNSGLKDTIAFYARKYGGHK